MLERYSTWVVVTHSLPAKETGIPGEMGNLGSHFSEPQAFHLLYGDKNATLTKLFLKVSELAGIKSLFSGRQLPFCQ